MLRLSYSLADQNVATTKSIGIFNCSTQLASRLSREPRVSRLTIFGNRGVEPYLDLAPGRVGLECHDYASRRDFGRILWDQWAVYRAARRAGNEWLILPKGFCSFLRAAPVRVAAYVHDAMLDFYQSHYPRYFPRFERWYFGKSLDATLSDAEVVFTNSDFSRREIIRLAEKRGRSHAPVVTVGYGFVKSESESESDRDCDRPVTERQESVLALLSPWPHKRADLTLAFLERWRQDANYHGPIHAAGGLPQGMKRPERGWEWHGRLAPEALRDLMRKVRAVVYFSDYEGFGMPPVEAVLEGACPVFSSLPATQEVMGSIGHAFDNRFYESFAGAMNNALRTAPERLADWTQQLLARHNWDKVADRVTAALCEASGSRT